MGATSARKARSILRNSEHVIAVEALSAAQGLDLRAPLGPARATNAARELVRKASPHLDEDRSLSAEIQETARLIRDGAIAQAVEDSGVPLA